MARRSHRGFRIFAQVLTPKNLLELHDHVSAAKVFVGNDSGPTHLAGILGIPTVAIFGPTSNAVAGSRWGRGCRIVSGDLDELPVDTVHATAAFGTPTFAAVAAQNPLPCTQGRGQGEGTAICDIVPIRKSKRSSPHPSPLP